MAARTVSPSTTEPVADHTGTASRNRRRSTRWAAALALSLAAAVTTTAAGPASAQEALAAPAAAPLSFAPPELTNPTVIKASASNRNLKLDPTRDYIIQMPSTPLTTHYGLQIHGGNDVVLIGGQINIPITALDITTSSHAKRGLYLHGQTGTIHVEGLHITGEGLGEGINLDQRKGAVVQLQNIRVDATQGSLNGHHADVLQTWAGPRKLLVDGLTGHTHYQGFFLLPTQLWSTDPVEPELFDLRRVDITGTPNSGYMLWRDGLSWPLTVQDVWVAPKNPLWRDGFLWPKSTKPGSESWAPVNVGAPPQGEFVPAGGAGLGYVSPGYAPQPETPAVVPATELPMTEPALAPVLPPVGALDGVDPVAGGLRVHGWAADGDTTAPLEVDITTDGQTRRVTADVARPDVAGSLPEVGGSTGFDTVVPLAPGEHEVCVTAVNVGSGTDTSFGCRTATVTDVTAPVFAGAPLLDLRVGTVSPSRLVPATARWSVSDDVAVDAVRLTSPAAVELDATATAADVDVPLGSTSVAVAADDAAGNTGTAAGTPTVTYVDDTVATRVNYWWGVNGSALMDGSARRTNRAGASMSHTFTGRSVAWVASKASDHGRAHVYVDGVLQETVDLGAATKSHREVVFTQSWAEAGSHTIQVVVEGTRGRAYVTSDGFLTVG